jgi:PIN domain nuclease of toxin-antitoxin system
LLDTHILVWLTTDRAKLASAELRILNDPDHSLLVSPIAFWELRLKWSRFFRSGDRKGPGDPVHFLAAVRRFGLSTVSFEVEQAVAALGNTISHSDPFDELLLVHAQELGARLMTRDRKLADHPLAFTP